MYVCMPIRLEFRPDKTRHSENDISVLRIVNLDGNVKAVVGETSWDAFEGLKSDVIEFINKFLPNFYGRVRLSDFTFVYDNELIENGRFWSGKCCNSYTRLE